MIRAVPVICLIFLPSFGICEEASFSGLLNNVISEFERSREVFDVVTEELQKEGSYLEELRSLTGSSSDDLERKAFLLSKVKEQNDRSERAMTKMLESTTDVFALTGAASEYCGKFDLSSQIKRTDIGSSQGFVESVERFRDQIKTIKIDCSMIDFKGISMLLGIK